MIFRLSNIVAAKVKLLPTETLPLEPNPLADWSANLFTAERAQVLLITNTVSLYSTLLPGRGIANETQFVSLSQQAIREYLDRDGLPPIDAEGGFSLSYPIRFSKALNRSVISSMNDLIGHAKLCLIEDGLSLFETARILNDIPFKPLSYQKPTEVFSALAINQGATSQE